MKLLSISFAVLFRAMMLPAVLSAAVAGVSERKVVETVETHIFGGRELRVATVPIASNSGIIAATAATSGAQSLPVTSLSKRGVISGCFDGTITTCANGLSLSPDPPLEADCTALTNAIEALAQSQVTTTFPCDVYGRPQCPSFTVPPQYERTYTIGTCQTAFVNLLPVGGNSVQYCDYLIAGGLPSRFNRCIVTEGFTGSYSLPNGGAQAWAVILRHS